MKYKARIIGTNGGGRMTVCANCGRLPHKGRACGEPESVPTYQAFLEKENAFLKAQLATIVSVCSAEMPKHFEL